MRSVLFAVSFLLASTSARAGVIYNWVPNDSASMSTGQIVFTDEAWATGRSSFSHFSDYFSPSLSINGNVLSFSFRYHTRTLAVNFGPGATDGHLNFDVWLSAEGLSGSIYGNDGGAHVGMSGDTDLWFVSQFAADWDSTGECSSTYNDCQTTGHWRLVSVPPPAGVPEPLSTALLAVGLGAVMLRGRSRSQSRKSGLAGLAVPA